MTTTQSAPQAKTTPRAHWLLLALTGVSLITALIYTLYWVYLTITVYHIPTDEMLYADIGRLIARGHVPFREIWDIKPPVHNYLIAPFILVFGNTLLAIRVFVLLTAAYIVALTALLTYTLTQNKTAVATAALAATFYAAWSAYAEGFNPVMVMATLSLTAMWVAVLGRGRPLWMLASGLLLAASFLSKQVVAFEGFAALAFAAYFAPRDKRVTAAGWVIAGGVFGLGLAVGLALWAGVLESLWLNAFYNSFLYTFEPEGQQWHFSPQFFSLFRTYFVGGTVPFLLPLLLMSIPAWVLLLRDPQTRPITLVVTVWVITAFMGAAVGRSMRRSYFLEVLAPLIVLNVMAVPLYASLRRPWQVGLALLLALSLYANGLLRDLPRTVAQLAAANWHLPDEAPQLAPYRQTAAQLAAAVTPGTCFWEWDSIGVENYLADRRPCTSTPAAHTLMIRESFDIYRIRADYMNELFAGRPTVHTRYDIWSYFPELDRFADRYLGAPLFEGQGRYYDLQAFSVDMSPFRDHYANFAGEFEMIGYDLYTPEAVCAGDAIETSLTWRLLEPPQQHYNLFVQLITEDQTARVAGLDVTPHSDKATTEWTQPNMLYLGDRLSLPVPSATAPGAYWLVTGFYDVTTFERLPVMGADGTPLPGDYVALTAITVEACPAP